MKFFNSGPRVTFDENSNSGYSYPHEDDVTHKEERINTKYNPNAVPGKSILKKTKSSFLSKMVTSVKSGLGRVGAAIMRGVQYAVSGVKELCCYRTRHSRSEETSVYNRLNSEDGEPHQPKQEPIYINYLSVLGAQQQYGEETFREDNSRVHYPLPSTPQE